MSFQTCYLLRHGQTEYNLIRRLQGRLDSPLTAHGAQQARAMGRQLATLIPEPEQWTLLHSPLGRATASAKWVADELSIPHQALRADPRLVELSIGAWDGLTYDEIAERYPTLYARGQRDDWHFLAPDVEPYAVALQRARDWLADPDLPERLIVLSHGLFGQMLRGCYAGMSDAEILRLDRPQDAFFRLEGGAISRIDCTLQPA
ncbi:MAG: histidine phosphatase family protein [Burkholderiales bacterium]|nr:histidine phosphatase family protein [Burkholderiales bacterium]